MPDAHPRPGATGAGPAPARPATDCPARVAPGAPEAGVDPAGPAVTDPNRAWVRLDDGRPVLIRPLEPGDGVALAAAFAQLSARSRHLRFGSAPNSLGPVALRHLVDSVDGVNHVAFAAFTESGRLVGVGRILRDPLDPDTLDVGMAVADDYQGAGLGTVLSHLLADHRPRPAKRILTAVAADNPQVMSLFRAFGVAAVWTADGMLVELGD